MLNLVYFIPLFSFEHGFLLDMVLSTIYLYSCVSIRCFWYMDHDLQRVSSLIILCLDILYKDYIPHFAGFLRVFHSIDPFLECERFVNLAVHFIRRSSLILSCSSVVLFIYYVTCWNSEIENCGCSRGREVREIGQFSIIGKLVFHILLILFIEAIISI